MSDRQAKLSQQLKQLELQVASMVQKHDVQNKRIKFLKKENEELKLISQENQQISEQIQTQNASLKKKNRELKNKLNDMKKMVQLTFSSKGPQTMTIKDVIVSYKTEELDLPKAEVNDEDIEHLKSFSNLRTAILAQNFITDIGANIICCSLVNLRKLFMNSNQITHVGIKNISKLSHLRCLDLRINNIGDEGMLSICSLPQLIQVSVSNNGITDQGLAKIEKLQNLRYLDVTSNAIGNPGGVYISKLTCLNNLYLSHNKIQKQVAAKLIQLPEMKVLDLRFNEIDKQDKASLREKSNENLQLFL